MNKNLERWIIKTIPQKWTEKDIESLEIFMKNWLNNSEIAQLMWRSEISIGIKKKRLWKVKNSYNDKHRDDKYTANKEFIDLINPRSIIDIYAWDCFYKELDCKYITNDKDETKDTNYHLEAFEFLCNYNNQSFDIVDPDPFGSAFDCFDLAIRIANKWIVITLWELWHRRFKRLDFVKDRYWITDMKDDWIVKITEYLQWRGRIYKKTLTPVIVKDWWNIGRIYFKVEKYKELSQWNL